MSCMKLFEIFTRQGLENCTKLHEDSMHLVPSTLSYEKNSVIFFIVKMHSTTVSSQSKI